MDRKLLDLLVCPATRQPVALLDSRGLEALNQAIAGGSVVRSTMFIVAGAFLTGGAAAAA